jgi:hypothetical protein
MEAEYLTETVVARIANRLHDATIEKTAMFSHIPVKTSNPIKDILETGCFHSQVEDWGMFAHLCLWTGNGCQLLLCPVG